MVKCTCAGCDKKLRPGCHSSDNMCPTCCRAGHWATIPSVQRILHYYEYNRNKFQLIRKCAICGHLLNIWINKKTRRVPDNLWFSDELITPEAFPNLAHLSKVEREYWECAVCLKADDPEYITLALTVPNSASLGADDFQYRLKG